MSIKVEGDKQSAVRHGKILDFKGIACLFVSTALGITLVHCAESSSTDLRTPDSSAGITIPRGGSDEQPECDPDNCRCVDQEREGYCEFRVCNSAGFWEIVRRESTAELPCHGTGWHPPGTVSEWCRYWFEQTPSCDPGWGYQPPDPDPPPPGPGSEPGPDCDEDTCRCVARDGSCYLQNCVDGEWNWALRRGPISPTVPCFESMETPATERSWCGGWEDSGLPGCDQFVN